MVVVTTKFLGTIVAFRKMKVVWGLVIWLSVIELLFYSRSGVPLIRMLNHYGFVGSILVFYVGNLYGLLSLIVVLLGQFVKSSTSGLKLLIIWISLLVHIRISLCGVTLGLEKVL